MIRIDTPPMLRNDSAEDIKGLRNYLYRELNSLQTQLNMRMDESDLAIAAAGMTGGTSVTPAQEPSSGIEEAPIDGKQYARQDGSWAEVTVPSESYINGLIDAKLGVIENGSY